MKIKRILALAAVFIILALYLSTIVLALSGSPNTPRLLMASLFCTIVLPCIVYAWLLVWNRGRDKKEDDRL